MKASLVALLHDARISKKMKQNEVAHLLGIKGNTLSNWETGRTEPDVDTFIHLCSIYGIDAGRVLSDAYGNSNSNSPTIETDNDLSDNEIQLIENYRSLNEEGQEKLLDTSDDLVQTGKYKKRGASCMGREA